MLKRIQPILCVGALLLSGCSSSLPEIHIFKTYTSEDKLLLIDTWLKNLSTQKQFNGAILIAMNGRVDLINTYGYSDPARTNPLTLESSFRLASVSKQFTAMAIMILKERRQIKFDDPVQKHLPEFPYSDVTIRHLLTHTSGISEYEKLVLKFKNKWSTRSFYITGQSWENRVYKGEPSQYRDSHDILSIKDVLDLVVRFNIN